MSIQLGGRSRIGRAGRVVSLAALTFLALGALGGGAALILAPDGSLMGFRATLLEGSPFPDFLVPGLILGGVFGVGSLVVVILGLRDHPLAPFLAFAIGCAQMIWITVQLGIIGIENVSFLHPMMFLVGAIVALAAVPWGWPTLQAWREGWRP
jgi:hypothetical protein